MMDMRKSPAFWLCTWFGCGLLKPAPGTWGTLGALPFGVALMLWGLPQLALATILISLVGYMAVQSYQAKTGVHDAGHIVIDEVAGIWLTLMAALPTPLSVGVAFLLFRAFDILKPWPVSWADRKLTGAVSVMLDDLLAGVYAVIVLIGLRYAGIDL